MNAPRPVETAFADRRAAADMVAANGPGVVALGGGTGLPNLLRGLRPLLFGGGRAAVVDRGRLVAVVATTDDGGSSGELRKAFGVIPPGDIRNCLAALSEGESRVVDLFQYRFGGGNGLSGHAVGNLVLTALADVMHDFALAVETAAQLLDARGTVLPATLEPVTLMARLKDGRVLTGETAISAAGAPPARLWLSPARPACSEWVATAITRADVVVVGPGSLYSSVLPPLLVPDIARALAGTAARRVMVLNLMTEPGETDGLTAADHLRVVQEHVGEGLIDCVLYSTSRPPAALAADYGARGAAPLVTSPADLDHFTRSGVHAVGLPLAAEHPAGKVRHQPDRLGRAILAIAGGRLGVGRPRLVAGGR
jgi:uncharacterized cofD-like protein